MIVIAKETLDFRCSNYLFELWLLVPTFSLLIAPPRLTARLRCDKNAPLPLEFYASAKFKPVASVLLLSPVTS